MRLLSLKLATFTCFKYHAQKLFELLGSIFLNFLYIFFCFRGTYLQDIERLGKTGLILFFKVNYQFRKLTIYSVEDKSKTLKREEIEFLNFVDENAKMGVNSI